MKEPYSEDLASHAGPESCISTGNGTYEALTGVHVGQVLNRENNTNFGVPTSSGRTEGNICCIVKGEIHQNPAWSENRHSYTDVPPSGLGFESGYLGLFEAPFSDQGSRLTNLHWKQYFAEGTWTFVGGFLYTPELVDVYAISSPWTGFTNFMFSTGSGAMDLPSDAALGAGVGGLIGGKMYVHAGFVDAYSDPTDPFSDVWRESDFFKWVEIGYTPGARASYFLDKIHLTYWHVDERADSTPDGWGLSASWHTKIDDKWSPFIRGGYTKESGSLLERSISVGLSYYPVSKRGVIGFGFNWGRPNETSYEDLDDQYTTELFWRYQMTTELAITPTIQYIRDPALNPDEDSLWAFGLRLRVVL